MCTFNDGHRRVGSDTVRRALCNAQIPNADYTVPPARAEQTGMLWVPCHRFHGACVSA